MTKGLPPGSGDVPGSGRNDGVQASPSPAADGLWISGLIAGLRGRRDLNAQQKLFMELAGKVRRTAQEERQFQALATAEAAANQSVRGILAAVEVSRNLRASRQAESGSRTMELRRSAALLTLAGLLDAGTGLPLWDRGELLGALLELAKTPAGAKVRASWKRAGDAALAAANRPPRNSRSRT